MPDKVYRNRNVSKHYACDIWSIFLLNTYQPVIHVAVVFEQHMNYLLSWPKPKLRRALDQPSRIAHNDVAEARHLKGV